MELGEYDHRLGANDPTDFPGERFKEKELESNPSDSTGNFTLGAVRRSGTTGLIVFVRPQVISDYGFLTTYVLIHSAIRTILPKYEICPAKCPVKVVTYEF